MTNARNVDPFDEPDTALPTEDDDPELLAGEPVTFDPDSPDDGQPVDQPAPPAESGEQAGGA
jgi:hypothetical protein